MWTRSGCRLLDIFLCAIKLSRLCQSGEVTRSVHSPCLLFSHVVKEAHFSSDHYPCAQSTCQAQKFVVFGSVMDLKAHMVEQHGANMSTKDIKEARRVEANFEFNDNRGAGSRRRERDREADSNRVVPPRADMPQNRAQDRRREGFGAVLTSQTESGTNAPASQRDGRTSPSPPRNIDPETAGYIHFLGQPSPFTDQTLTGDMQHSWIALLSLLQTLPLPRPQFDRPSGRSVLPNLPHAMSYRLSTT